MCESCHRRSIGLAQMASLNPTNELLALVDESEKRVLEVAESQAA